MIPKKIQSEKLDFRHVASALNDWQPGILRESRICHGELAKVELGTSVGLDNFRVLTVKAQPDE